MKSNEREKETMLTVEQLMQMPKIDAHAHVMGLPDVVQILFHGRKSGKLSITSG